MARAVDILLVEDNSNDEELTLYALRKSKLASNVDIVRDGAEALDYLFCTGIYAQHRSDDSPRLILLDLKLPKVDGLEVLRRLKADVSKRHTPVVVLSSSKEERDISECYRLGVNSYIVKPIDFQQFTETVRTLVTYWLTLNQGMIGHHDLNKIAE